MTHDEIISWFYSYKSTQKCAKCGESHPAVLHFHHIDPSTKKYNVSHLVQLKSCTIKKLKEELANCMVLCHNCHSKYHYNERKKEKRKINKASNSKPKIEKCPPLGVYTKKTHKQEKTS